MPYGASHHSVPVVCISAGLIPVEPEAELHERLTSIHHRYTEEIAKYASSLRALQLLIWVFI